MTLNLHRILFAALSCGLVFTLVPALEAQQADNPPAQAEPANGQDQGPDQGTGQTVDPLKRQRSDKEKLTAQRALRQELKGAYKTWLEQDVAYIITDEERKAFKTLGNDEERDAFIENFWLRRNPNPDSPENEFREEHYRRIAYANEHYAAGKPGWKTDRGHIYIAYGPPDSIDAHPSGGNYQRSMEEGDLEFVDTCQCGDYHFTTDKSEKDALLHTPGAGLTQSEEMGKSTKANRFQGGTGQNKEFDNLELASKIFAPPPIKFKDLDSFISEHKLLTGPVFPFDVRTDFIRVTENTDLVPITLQIKNRDVTFVTRDGVSKGVVNILGKVTTITGKTAQTFEDTVAIEQPVELLEKSLDRESVYWKALPLLPGLYRLDIAIKDVNNPDHMGIYGRALNVPSFHDEKLGLSSLILADRMSPVDSHSIGSGNFVIGNTYIRPRVSANPATAVKFKRDQQLNIWMQVYNLGIDEATKSNHASVTYQIVKTVAATASIPASDTVVFEKQLDSKELGAHSDQVTVEKTLPIAGLEPGKYKVTIKINDAISNQEIAQSAPFVVE